MAMKKPATSRGSQSAEDRLAKLKADQVVLKGNLGKNIYTNAADARNRKFESVVEDGVTQLGELFTGNLRSLDEGGPSARRRTYAMKQDSQAGQRISDRSKVIGRLAAQIARKKRNQGKK